MHINKYKTSLNLIDRRFILEDCHQKQKKKKIPNSMQYYILITTNFPTHNVSKYLYILQVKFHSIKRNVLVN